MKKTNAARFLDKMNIAYQTAEYEVDEDNLGAENVAAKIGLPLEQVYKTLVARGDKTGVVLACVPGSGELDLKALAAVSGNKKVEMVHLKDVLPLTGYIRGGVSPIGTKKPYPVYIHEEALRFPFIAVSAGVRGCQLILNPQELIKVLNASSGKLIRE